MKSILVLISLFPLYAFATDINSLNEQVEVVKSELDLLKKTLKIGTSDKNLSKSEFLKVGYGHCENFADLLRDSLSQKSIPSRSVALISKSGGGHNLLEVKLGKNWYLTDPMNNVIYKNSLLEILQQPKLANNKLSYDLTCPAPNLTKENFFSDFISVDFGELYFSDSYRHYPLSTRDYENKPNKFECEHKTCTWNIPVSNIIKNDALLNEFNLFRILPLQDNIEFDFTSLNLIEFKSFSWRVPYKNGFVKFVTKSDGPHSFIIYAIANAAEDAHALNMRMSKPNTFIFRGNEIDFYNASFSCNNKEKWKATPNYEEEFHNSMYLPYDSSSSSAWSTLRSNESNIPYRTSIMNLSGNEPRIRFLPYHFKSKDACELSLQYRNHAITQLWIHYEATNEVIKFADIPACPEKVCTFKKVLTKNEADKLAQ